MPNIINIAPTLQPATQSNIFLFTMHISKYTSVLSLKGVAITRTMIEADVIRFERFEMNNVNAEELGRIVGICCEHGFNFLS